ncbi:MAG TPA: hypothetical protein VML00_11990, partial [Bacteroidota bacterium]|nr:hypothetical protein [Bacteroidota bacterium]
MKISSFAVMVFVLGGAARAQDPDLLTFLRSLPGPVVSGYDSTISGETMLYHSVNPHARNALIARATEGEESIEWLTAPVPSRPAGSVIFSFLAGLSGSKGEHAFFVDVDGSRLFRFTTPADT